MDLTTNTSYSPQRHREHREIRLTDKWSTSDEDISIALVGGRRAYVGRRRGGASERSAGRELTASQYATRARDHCGGAGSAGWRSAGLRPALCPGGGDLEPVEGPPGEVVCL